MNGNGEDFFSLSNFELFRLRFLAAGGFTPFDPFTGRFSKRLVSQLRPSGGISGLVPAAAGQTSTILASVPTRGASISNEGELPVALPVGLGLPRLPGPSLPASGSPASWAAWVAQGLALPSDWNRFPTPAAKAAAASNINMPPKGDSPMAIDLGNLITTLGTALIDAKFGGVTAVTGGQVVPTGGANGIGTPSVPFRTAGIAQDMFCPNPDDPALGKLSSCRVDPCTGLVTLVKRKRRRRRSLATSRDIADIAALMGAFNVKGSQQQSLTTWIATRGR